MAETALLVEGACNLSRTSLASSHHTGRSDDLDQSEHMKIGRVLPAGQEATVTHPYPYLFGHSGETASLIPARFTEETMIMVPIPVCELEEPAPRASPPQSEPVGAAEASPSGDVHPRSHSLPFPPDSSGPSSTAVTPPSPRRASVPAGPHTQHQRQQQAPASPRRKSLLHSLSSRLPLPLPGRRSSGGGGDGASSSSSSSSARPLPRDREKDRDRIRMVRMTRGEYLAYWARDARGKYVGTEPRERGPEIWRERLMREKEARAWVGAAPGAGAEDGSNGGSRAGRRLRAWL
ncbi:hypothetical protein BDY21DRAFT_353795 [Lineolata rhizophorae]|uniref:Uncharacterized protein n=1 Tax=Lineolata rhizophorae TaxID=578093 RepID=A0A6A6NSD9_9PEZI|nr:hypothetical protein BDY21DRAFT_353795 [Lineolata rhizophorae]